MGADGLTRNVGRGSLVHGTVCYGGCCVVKSNLPVNADARGRAAICARSRARAGYRARKRAVEKHFQTIGNDQKRRS